MVIIKHNYPILTKYQATKMAGIKLYQNQPDVNIIKQQIHLSKVYGFRPDVGITITECHFASFYSHIPLLEFFFLVKKIS